MATSLLWIAGIVLELVILFRFLKCRLYAHYPFFFAYMAIVCFFSVVALAHLPLSSGFVSAVLLDESVSEPAGGLWSAFRNRSEKLP